MFNSFKQSDDREHTVTIALLAVAFLFIPALALFSQPVSYWPAVGASVLCVAVAGFYWRKSGTVAVPAEATKREPAE